MASVEILELTRASMQNYERVVEAMARIDEELFPELKPAVKSYEGKSEMLYFNMIGDDGGDEVGGFVLYLRLSSISASVPLLAVKEKYQRQGHGEALLRAAIEKCRRWNVGRVHLHVDPSRIAALNLYCKLGFRFATLNENYYSYGQHAYSMYLAFNDNICETEIPSPPQSSQLVTSKMVKDAKPERDQRYVKMPRWQKSNEEKYRMKLEHYRGWIHASLVVTLILAVTFAAGFGIPGGYQSDGPNKGMAAILLSKPMFSIYVLFYVYLSLEVHARMRKYLRR